MDRTAEPFREAEIDDRVAPEEEAGARAGAAEPHGSGPGPELPVSDSPATGPPSRGWWARLPDLVVVVALVAAVPVILRSNRTQWFVLDEWYVLVDRSLAPHDLLRRYNDHWVALPIVAYRVLYRFVGLHHYWPYQLLTVACHLVSASLLWLVMRRAAVRPWVAATATVAFAYFGSGRANLAWGFQVTFTAALALGLGAVLLVDHDGPPSGRDVAAVLLGIAALACSGVGVAMAVAVAVTAGVRRGWGVALVQVLPLAAVYAAWYGRYGSPPVRGTTASPSQVLDFDGNLLWAVAEGFGGGPFVGALLALAVAVGLGLTAWTAGAGERRRLAAPAGLLVAGAAFLAVTGYVRAAAFPEVASRYVHVVAALALPAVAVGLSAVADRWRWAPPVVVAALIIGMPTNVRRLEPHGEEAALKGQPNLVLAVAAVEVPPGAPSGFRPIWSEPALTLEWLQQARRAGRVPDPPDPSFLEMARVRVTLEPLYEHGGRHCRPVDPRGLVTLAEGEVLRVGGTNALVRLAGVAGPHAFAEFHASPILGSAVPADDGAPVVRLRALDDVRVKVWVGRGDAPSVEHCESA